MFIIQQVRARRHAVAITLQQIVIPKTDGITQAQPKQFHYQIVQKCYSFNRNTMIILALLAVAIIQLHQRNGLIRQFKIRLTEQFARIIYTAQLMTFAHQEFVAVQHQETVQ